MKFNQKHKIKEQNMKTCHNREYNNKAFSIIELLTIMSIIVILMGLLMPALQRVKRFAKKVQQKNQFHSISVALELFNTEFEGLPDSGRYDPNGDEYCGAMRLCEAMVGQDLLGYHQAANFTANDLGRYPLNPNAANLAKRSGPYIQLESADAHLISDLYATYASFTGKERVLCDVYGRIKIGGGKKIGLPVLYYKANTSKTTHDPTTLLTNIYNFEDNIDLINLGLPFNVGFSHLMSSNTSTPTSNGLTPEWEIFYENTRNRGITSTSRPYRADSYILISAGFDGEYGTADDVFNFGN